MPPAPTTLSSPTPKNGLLDKRSPTTLGERRADDSVFHLSPLAPLVENTISPIVVCLQKNGSESYCDDEGGGAMSQSVDQDIPAVPAPTSPAEAYLLLETACADRQVRLTRRDLVHQIVHRNTLALQYNRLMLEKAHADLQSADRFIGRVRFVIRQNGIPVAHEYAAREDHLFCSSPPSPSCGSNSANHPFVPSFSVLDVNLD